MYDDTDGTGHPAERTGGADARLSTLFHETTAEIDPDVSGLVQGGIARGQVKRRHRNAGTALAAVAVVGVVGLGVSIAPSIGSGAGTVVQPAGSTGSGTTSAPATTTAGKTTTGKTAPAKSKSTGPLGGAVADIPVKAADLPGLFTDLYPGKVTPAEKRTGRIIDNGREGQYAHFLWNGFLTTVGFAAYHGTPAERCRELQQAEVPPGAKRLPLTCTARPDGTVLMTWRDKASARDGGGTGQAATLFTKDGYEIDAISYNWARKGGPNLAETPPLGIAQLTHAVTSDVWFR